MTTDTRRHTPAQHDDGQACLGCGQDWPCATERERQRIVDDWLASPEAERALAEVLHDADGIAHPVGGTWTPGTCEAHRAMARAILAALREQAAGK